MSVLDSAIMPRVIFGEFSSLKRIGKHEFLESGLMEILITGGLECLLRNAVRSDRVAIVKNG